MPLPTSQTGAAGEFYVAAQLSQRGWAASLLLGNARHINILARHAETGTTIAAQVKAANGGGDFQAGARPTYRAPLTREIGLSSSAWVSRTSVPSSSSSPGT